MKIQEAVKVEAFYSTKTKSVKGCPQGHPFFVSPNYHFRK